MSRRSDKDDWAAQHNSSAAGGGGGGGGAGASGGVRSGRSGAAPAGAGKRQSSVDLADETDMTRLAREAAPRYRDV